MSASRSLGTACRVFSGRNAQGCFKAAVQMALVAKTSAVGNFGYCFSLCNACPVQAFHHPRMRINPGCFRRCSPVPREVIVLIQIGANRRLHSELKLLPLLLPYILVCQQSTGKNL